MSIGIRRLVRRLVMFAAVMAVALFATAALAAGTVKWTTTKLKENTDTKSWTVEIAIFLPKAPDVPTLPMKFEFEPTVYYERARVDPDKLVERKVPLENRQPIIEGVDVGFLDPGSGKTEKRTKFVFKISRGHGFEAGEYTCTIRDARTGSVVGSATHLVFDGENEIIDRRAIVFTGESKKKKKPDDKKDEGGGEKSSDGGGGGSEKSESSEGKSAEKSAAEEPPPDEPKEIKEKPSGCGCRAPTAAPAADAALLSLGALGMLLVRRRRKS